MNMNQTIDCFGPDNLIIHERPLTISYIDENSPQKFCNLSQLLASQNTKRTKKISRRSLYQVNLKDYYYQTYIPTRSPPSLQLQLQNYQYNTSKSTNTRKNKFIKQKEAKCKTLPLNDFNYDEIQKRIELKKMMLEKMYLIKDNQKTQTIKTDKTEEVFIPQKLKTDVSIQCNNKQKKNQEIQTYRPTQSRIGSSYYNNRKMNNTFQAMPLSLGLNIEKCKIVERFTQSPFYSRTSKKISQKNCSVGDRGQKFMIMQKPIMEQFCLQKKSSIPVAKWDHSDLEND
ncbi:unnamed protein product [Paramecium octaurelia]|uniref:Uncharacterized protein n=1 Tax=Paramecium octaurelia TaxID=43137 RepID=A0A8S1UIH4_PAROT|nr:unnamed protein product [Paramecium octaurelia]